MKNPDNPKQYTPNPETAPVIKRIFAMYASGVGIDSICAALKKDKIESPSVYTFKRTGKKIGIPDMANPYCWSKKTVKQMLTNQAYVGDTVNFKTYSKSNKLKKRLKNAPENMLIFENTHEAIIDRKTFDIVQKHFEGRKRPDKQWEMDKYAGYLFCGEYGKYSCIRKRSSIHEQRKPHCDILHLSAKSGLIRDRVA